MRVVVTGATGTVGTALCAALRRREANVVAWNRAIVPPLDAHAGAQWLDEVAPDVLFHLAIASHPTGAPDEAERINVAWAARLARWCADHQVPLVFTSTVMVYSDQARGPFTPDVLPDAAAGYGAQKLQAETAIRAVHPGARIARIGWQIAPRAPGNHMVAWLDEQQHAQGRIEASTRWLPACSFLVDTAEVLADLLAFPPGTYHVSSNTEWSFHEIAAALNALHQHPWNIVPTSHFVQDQRLLDARLSVPPLSIRLPGLRSQ